MPFFSWLKKSSSKHDLEADKDAKMQLTLKVLQSQQSTEPVFDISGCHAHYVPDQTYTYCKLLKKTKLLLNNNALTSLEEGGDINDLITVQYMSLHNNKFSSLPTGIGCMKNLCHLDVSDNSLKSLPNSISSLKKLQIINLDNNNFSKVPACLCALKKLQQISMLGNKVKDVPKELFQLQTSLKVLVLNSDHLKNTVREVYIDGAVGGLMRYSCEGAGVEYVGVVEEEEGEDEPDVGSPSRTAHVSCEYVYCAYYTMRRYVQGFIVLFIFSLID